MIYKVAGPVIGNIFMKELFDLLCGYTINAKFFGIIGFILGSLVLMLPQIVVSRTLANNMLRVDDERLEPLYEEGLLIRENQDEVLINDE